MKIFCLIALTIFTAFAPIPNKPVDKVDVNRFAGKWYSLYSIPTMFDKGTSETTTTYTLNNDGYYNVVTTAKKEDNKLHTYKSKLFPIAEDGNAEMKAQFVWPFKVDYWVIDLAKDYSYVVVGHPEHKFLFIMSRRPSIDKKLYEGLVAKCKAMGYPVEKLTSQHHD
ncbi:MAG: lipocalin family protein [Bacteroidota bacterium]